MTVGELIERLKDIDQSLPVYAYNCWETLIRSRTSLSRITCS